MMKMILSYGRIAAICIFKYILIGLLFLSGQNIFSQQMLGLGFDNYNGSAGAMLNPAFLTDSKVHIDVNLITTDIFMENNIGYIDKDSTGFWDLVRMAGNSAFRNWDIHLVTYKNHDAKNFAAISRVQGPSVMVRTGRQAFALGISVHSVSTGINIPYQLAASHGRLSNPLLVHNRFDDNNLHILLKLGRNQPQLCL